MITSTLLIKEMPDGNVMVAMDPDQSGATKAELRVASIMDSALQAVGELILKGSKWRGKGCACVEKASFQLIETAARHLHHLRSLGRPLPKPLAMPSQSAPYCGPCAAGLV